MNSKLKGQWLRSESVQYALGSNFPVKLDFLAPALQMTVPEVHRMVFILTGTMNTTAGPTTALGRDAWKLIDRVLLQDEAEVVNASGACLRVLRQVELGAKATDPADLNNFNGLFEYRFEVIFQPLDTRHIRPRDFTIPVEHFLNGGTLSWATPAAVPTGCGPVAGDWRLRVEMLVADGRVRELKSRRRIFEQVINQQEFQYPANGSIRQAIITSKLTTTGYTTLVGETNLYSRTLDLPPNFAVSSLVADYVQGADSLGANDEFLLAAPGAIPLVVPYRAQKIGRMINAPTIHLDLLQAAPASARLLLDLVIDRTPNLAALTMGYQSPGALSQAIQQHGVVKGASDSYKASSFYQPLLKRLPVQIDPTFKG